MKRRPQYHNKARVHTQKVDHRENSLAQKQKSQAKDIDGVFEYAREVLALGLFYEELH